MQRYVPPVRSRLKNTLVAIVLGTPAGEEPKAALLSVSDVNSSAGNSVYLRHAAAQPTGAVALPIFLMKPTFFSLLVSLFISTAAFGDLAFREF